MSKRPVSTFSQVPDSPWTASPITLAFQQLRSIKHSATMRTFQKSYSYFGEDLYCLQFLPEDHGRYLDIGSGHPVRGSNTYLLYRRGWSGILIDPIKRWAKLTSRKRKRDTFLPGILGNGGTISEFFEFTPWEISTVSREHASDLLARQCGQLLRVDAVKRIQWKDLGLSTTPKEPYLLSIDVETTEMEVLLSIDFDAFIPRVICIEDSEGPMFSGSSTQKFLTSFGYVWVGAVGSSRIMVHSAYLEDRGLVDNVGGGDTDLVHAG